MIRILVPLGCVALAMVAASCTHSGAPFDLALSHRSSSAPGAVQAAEAAAPSASAAASSPGDKPVPHISVGPIEGTMPPLSSVSAPSPAPQPPPPVIAPQRRASSMIGMRVVSPDGEPLGFVQDIVLNRRGRATHLVVAFGDQGNGGKLTVVPWKAAVSSIRDDHLVIDGAKLQGAPSFIPGDWPNIDRPSWSATADAYWRSGTGPAPPKSAPIDSTARTRARPSRPD
jgi:sporulation protein YlmC with PRC-barrel domain